MDNNNKASEMTKKKTYPSDLIVLLDIDETMICAKHLHLKKHELDSYPKELRPAVTEDGAPTSQQVTKAKGNGDDEECPSSVSTTITCSQSTSANKNRDDAIQVLQICGRKVYIRPELPEFLAKVATTFETHIYTGSSKEYAMAVAKALDPKGTYFSEERIWYNEHCFAKLSPPHPNNIISYGKCFQYKDLSRLAITRDKLHRVVLIDDYDLNMEMNRSNVILVKSFDDDPNDSELQVVQKYLFDELKDCDDVRSILKAKNEKEVGPPFEFWPWWNERKEYRGDI